MKVKSVCLQEEYGFGGELDCLAMDFPFDVEREWKRPAVIVVPGGSYEITSKREGEPVALDFLTRGFQAFVLRYEVASDGASYPRQLLQLASAVDYVKKHAKEYFVDEKKVFIVGFSAGGHLVANLAVEHQRVSEIAGKPLDCKPTAVGLGYPVIDYETRHELTYQNVLAGYEGEERAKLIERLSLQKSVNEQTPPAFLWTTAEDSGVDSRNTLLYAMALAERKIPYELHVYPQGEHGASNGSAEINDERGLYQRIRRWVEDCVSFFTLCGK